MVKPRKDWLNHHAKQREKFLSAYEQCGMMRQAARSVPMSHTRHYYWLIRVPGYAEKFNAAHKKAIANLGPRVESEIVSRALEGDETLIIYNGEPVLAWADEDGQYVPPPEDPKNPGKLRLVLYKERVKSVRLLMILARRLMPEYVEKVDHTGIPVPDPINEKIRKMLEDRDTTELANALARRMALNAGGDGKSSN